MEMRIVELFVIQKDYRNSLTGHSNLCKNLTPVFPNLLLPNRIKNKSYNIDDIFLNGQQFLLRHFLIQIILLLYFFYNSIHI